MGSFFSAARATSDKCATESFPNLLELLESKKDADVTLICGGKSFEVHAQVLEAHSDVFKAIFASVGRSRVVSINDITPEMLHHLLHFLYSGELEAIIFTHALKLYEAAKLYEIHPLERKTLKLIESGLEDTNVCDVLSYSHSKGYGNLKDVVIGYIVEHKKFLLSETWRMFSQHKPELTCDILAAITRQS